MPDLIYSVGACHQSTIPKKFSQDGLLNCLDASEPKQTDLIIGRLSNLIDNFGPLVHRTEMLNNRIMGASPPKEMSNTEVGQNSNFNGAVYEIADKLGRLEAIFLALSYEVERAQQIG